MVTNQKSYSGVGTRFFVFDLDIWPTTLTYSPNLANVKVDLHTEYKGRRSNGSAVRGDRDGRTDRLTDATSALSPCFAVDNQKSYSGTYRWVFPLPSTASFCQICPPGGVSNLSVSYSPPEGVCVVSEASFHHHMGRLSYALRFCKWRLRASELHLVCLLLSQQKVAVT